MYIQHWELTAFILTQLPSSSKPQLAVEVQGENGTFINHVTQIYLNRYPCEERDKGIIDNFQNTIWMLWKRLALLGFVRGNEKFQFVRTSMGSQWLLNGNADSPFGHMTKTWFDDEVTI